MRVKGDGKPGAAMSGPPGLGGRVQATCLPQGRMTRCALTSSILASKISRTQNQWDYLEVLFAALSTAGAPKGIGSRGGGIFYCNQAMDVYAALSITKERIERRQAWQNYIESHFNIARKMADARFARATSWEEVLAIHRRRSRAITTCSATGRTRTARMAVTAP